MATAHQNILAKLPVVLYALFILLNNVDAF